MKLKKHCGKNFDLFLKVFQELRVANSIKKLFINFLLLLFAFLIF